MPVSKKPRKKQMQRYRPMPYNPMFSATDEMRVNLSVPAHVSLDKFKRGVAEEQDWHCIAASLNVGAVLSRQESKEVQDVMSDALTAMLSSKARCTNTQRWILTGDEIKNIGAGVSLYSDLIDVARRVEVTKAIKIVNEEVAQ